MGPHDTSTVLPNAHMSLRRVGKGSLVHLCWLGNELFLYAGPYGERIGSIEHGASICMILFDAL